MAKILVVGGAGYVGSATCAWLMDSGHEVWVLDNLTTGHRELFLGFKFIEGNAGDLDLVRNLAKQQKFDGVMHFAARSLVSESIEKPEEYYENNVHQTTRLVNALLEAECRNFIFSSSCAIFGDPGTNRIHEKLIPNPLNPYGMTKLKVEENLKSLALSHGLHAIALRYFNAAGAEPKLRVGEWHDPESHLIPRILKSAEAGTPVEVYGTDYPTQDGTCVRDYVHVWDLALAHGLAMERNFKNAKTKEAPGLFEAFNLGSEIGYSVRDVISACEEVVGKSIKIIEKPRRPGDPPQLVADSTLAKKELGYKPRHQNLKMILDSAWQWEKKVSKWRLK